MKVVVVLEGSEGSGGSEKRKVKSEEWREREREWRYQDSCVKMARECVCKS